MRLLSTGLLLTIVLGAIVARLVFPHLSLWEAGILGAILAPTDAGLGQVIVNSVRVPLRIREALNVEAGLNDGLSVPFLLFFTALAVAGTEGFAGRLPQLILEQLGVGALIGAGIGLAGGWLLGIARRKDWMAGTVPANRRRRAAAALPGGVGAAGREHVHRGVCRPGWRCRSGSRKPASTAWSLPRIGDNCSTYRRIGRRRARASGSQGMRIAWGACRKRFRHNNMLRTEDPIRSLSISQFGNTSWLPLIFTRHQSQRVRKYEGRLSHVRDQ